jgi:hypothetical protein
MSATRTFTLLPSRVRTDSTESGQVGPVPRGTYRLRVYVASTDYTDPADEIAVGVEISRDGGATWRDVAGFTSVGGYVSPKTGLPTPPAFETNLTVDNDATLLRGTCTTIGTVTYALMADVTTVP